jgi:hypothetical protein
MRGGAVRTVFVIGAGANAEIGMPVGNELKTKIANLLNFSWHKERLVTGDELISSAILVNLKYHFPNDDFPNSAKLFVVASTIAKAMPLSISIDSYIEAQKGDNDIATCGKIAIARAILEAEQNCALFKVYYTPTAPISNTESIEQLNSSWYPLLFQKITEGCHINELAARLNDISFIIFNYDRCFEYFMYNALMIYYDIEHDVAKNFVNNLHINHPYGTVGNLWDNNDELTFGVTPYPPQLRMLADNIITFSESGAIDQKKDSSNRIQYLVERADRIIFLGFAYHDQNLNLLFNHPGVLNVMDGVPISSAITCYGTGYGMSDKDLEYLHEVLKAKNDKITGCDISGITCSAFFRDYAYRLTFK